MNPINNLITYPYSKISSGETVTYYGVTFTDNGDGTITANGTCNITTEGASVSYMPSSPFDLSAGTYRLSGCPSGGSETTYNLMLVVISGDSVYDYGSGTTFTLDKDYLVRLAIPIYANQTYNDLLFDPKLIKV